MKQRTRSWDISIKILHKNSKRRGTSLHSPGSPIRLIGSVPSQTLRVAKVQGPPYLLKGKVDVFLYSGKSLELIFNLRGPSGPLPLQKGKSLALGVANLYLTQEELKSARPPLLTVEPLMGVYRELENVYGIPEEEGRSIFDRLMPRRCAAKLTISRVGTGLQLRVSI